MSADVDELERWYREQRMKRERIANVGYALLLALIVACGVALAIASSALEYRFNQWLWAE